MKTIKLFGFLIFLVLIGSGCYTERISNQNLSYLYDADASFMHPEFVVTHKNDSVTLLHFRINSNELLYMLNGVSGFYSSLFRIRYEVYTQLESKLLIDSAVFLLADSSLVMQGKSISGVIELKPNRVKQSLLKIDLVDLRRTTRVNRYIEIDKRDPNSRQFFSLRAAETKHLLDRCFVGADEEFILEHASGAKTAKVRYYHREFPLPKPPFSVESPKAFDYEADSLFTMDLGQPLTLRPMGFYHVQIADSTKKGFTIFRFDESYPKVKSVSDLIEPLRFINSNAEYKALKESDVPKAEVDRFWLKLAGNPDRAKVLIQKYYSRVENSNEFFTCHTEGWKSDRGLIYLIFGPPNIIYKNTGSEHWIYGEENNPSSLAITFYKVENPFTDNDYRMDRSTIYKSSWYSAVDMWRQGRVYTDN